jgi:hypothetical protein
MAYPDSIYKPRERENWPGVVFNPEKKTIWFKEDAEAIENEIIAIEKDLFGPFFFDDFLRGFTQIANPSTIDKNSFIWYVSEKDAVSITNEINGVIKLKTLLAQMIDRPVLLNHNYLNQWHKEKYFSIEWLIRIDNPVMPGTDAKIEFGIGDVRPEIQPWEVFGMFFRNDGQHRNFVAVTKNEEGETITETEIEITTFEFFKCRIKSTREEMIEFYINDKLVATHGRNIYIRNIGPFILLTPSKLMPFDLVVSIDYCKIRQNR